MLGEVVAVEAGGVGRFDESKAFLVELSERHPPPVDPVEHPELDAGHGTLSSHGARRRGIHPRAKTSTALAGITIAAEAGSPCRGGPSASIWPPLPAAWGLTKLS